MTATIPPQSERSFQAGVIQLARVCKWTVFFTHDSRHSPAGMPDLLLLRPPRAVAAELKSQHGRVSAVQQRTLDLLALCGLETYLWRPSDKQRILEVLA